MSRRRRKKRRRQRELEALQGELLADHGKAGGSPALDEATDSTFDSAASAPSTEPDSSVSGPAAPSATPEPSAFEPEARPAEPEPAASATESTNPPRPELGRPESTLVPPEPPKPDPSSASQPAPAASASTADPPSEPAPEVAPDSLPDGLAPLPPPPSPDRWARALGHRSPARASSRGLAATAGDRTGPNGEALRTPDGQELHESARDHAAAGVRPAGEPLARAKELVQRGRIDEAIDLYLGILTVNPGNLKAHNNLGVLFDELRQYQDALEHFEAAERIAPESVEVLTNYASTLTSLARYDEAEALLRRAQKIDADGINVRQAIGVLYFRRGLYAQAEVELRGVCARDGDIGPAFYYRGEALNRLGRFDEARQAMERAKALMPNDPRPFLTLGHLYDRQHQAEEAAEMYRHARRLQKR